MRSTHLAAVAFVSALVGCSSEDGAPSTTTMGTDAGSTPEGGAGEAGAKKKNAETGCTSNEQCESNLCFVGGNQSYCSIPCTAANGAMVCTAPFTGSCNNRGACKRD